MTRDQTMPSWLRTGTHARRALLVAVGLSALVAVAVDRWFAERVMARARAEVRATAAMRADALLRAASREVSLLSALAWFTRSRRSRAQLDEEFPTFVDGLRAGRGFRALQLVEAGRIVAVWPLEGNEESLGLVVEAPPDAPVDTGTAAPVARATITGPVPLAQGGLGLIVGQPLEARRGFPDRAAIVLDVQDLAASAGIPERGGRVLFEVYNRSGDWFAGDPEGSAVAPETVAVATGDGVFRLLAAPARGWDDATARWQGALRGVLVLSILAIGIVAWLLGHRRDDLEAEVRRSGTALELVMRTSRMGGWQEDLATGQVRWNATIDAIIGRPVGSEAEGVERLAAAVDPADRPRLAAAMARARGEGATGFLEEVRVPARGGEPRWILVIADVVRDEQGRPARIVGVVADATERHTLQARLRHAQRLEALGKLAGGVAHDFNNLLTAIGAGSELAHARAEELPPEVARVVRGDLEQVIASSRRGAALTHQLLTFSRGREVARTPLDVGAAIAELLPTFAQLGAGRVRIEPHISADLPTVVIDGGQFGQVLTNLVVNARDAMPDGGEVRIRATQVAAGSTERPIDAPPGRWLVVEVQDDGVGMSAAVRERIFEPYFTTKPMGRGTGLGLAVVYGIVEAAGGMLTVQSAEGRGTTFRVFLPPAAAVA